MRYSRNNFNHYLVMIWHERKLFVASLCLLLIPGLIASMQVAPTYTAQATLIYAAPDLELEQGSGSKARPDVAGQIAASGVRVLTLSTLRDIAGKYLVKNEKTDSATLDNAALGLKDDVKIDFIQSNPGKAESTIGFSVSYTNPDASLARAVVEDITALYLQDGSQEGMRGISVALGLVQNEETRLTERVKELEKEIADFKQENANNLPELHEYNLKYLAMLKDEISDLQRNIRDREDRKRKASADLAEANPDSYIYTDSGKRLYTPSEQLELLEAEYVTKISRYSPAHPDVVSLKRKISALQAHVKGGNESKMNGRETMTINELNDAVYSANGTEARNYRATIAGSKPKFRFEGDDANRPPGARDGNGDGKAEPAVVSNNPIYQRLRSEVNSIDREIAMLRASESETKNKVLEYEKRLSREPEINRQLNNLLREYESTSERLMNITEKQFDSKLDLAIADKGAGSRYMQAEPTQVPDVANTRKRTLVAALSALLALGISTGLALFRSIKKQVIFDVKGLERIAAPHAILAVPEYRHTGAGVTLNT